MRKPHFQICASSAPRLLSQQIFTPNPHFSQTVHAKRLLSDCLFGDFSENISYFRYHFHCIFSCTPSFLQYPRCEMLVFNKYASARASRVVDRATDRTYHTKWVRQWQGKLLQPGEAQQRNHYGSAAWPQYGKC